MALRLDVPHQTDQVKESESAAEAMAEKTPG